MFFLFVGILSEDDPIGLVLKVLPRCNPLSGVFVMPDFSEGSEGDIFLYVDVATFPVVVEIVGLTLIFLISDRLADFTLLSPFSSFSNSAEVRDRFFTAFLDDAGFLEIFTFRDVDGFFEVLTFLDDGALCKVARLVDAGRFSTNTFTFSMSDPSPRHKEEDKVVFPPFSAIKSEEVEGVCRVVSFSDDGFFGFLTLRDADRFLGVETFSDAGRFSSSVIFLDVDGFSGIRLAFLRSDTLKLSSLWQEVEGVFPVCPSPAIELEDAVGVRRVETFSDDGRTFFKRETFSDDEEIGTVKLAFLVSNGSSPFS